MKKPVQAESDRRDGEFWAKARGRRWLELSVLSVALSLTSATPNCSPAMIY